MVDARVGALVDDPLELGLGTLRRLAVELLRKGALFRDRRARQSGLPWRRSTSKQPQPDRSAERPGVVSNLAGTAHEVVTAFARIVSIAVNEAERFISLDGPAKKQYAENTVMAVLNELGIGQGIVGAVLVRAGVSVAIDALVAVFNRRDYFVHKTAVPGGKSPHSFGRA